MKKVFKFKKNNCPDCKGTGEHKQRGGPTLICHECRGTGEKQIFKMMFWPYDHFPFVIGSRGFMQDNGTAYIPSYAMSIRPIHSTPLEVGKKLVDTLEDLTELRRKTLETLDLGWKAQLKQLAPFYDKKH